MRLNFNFSIPDTLSDKVKISEAYQNYNVNGRPTSFGVDLNLYELNLSKSLKSSDFHALKGKIENTLLQWEAKYLRHLDAQHKIKQTNSVEEMNKEATNKLDELHNILAKTLNINDAVDWETIKQKEEFKVKPEQFCENSIISVILFADNGKPEKVKNLEIPPQPKSEEFKSTFGFFSRIFRKKYIEQEFIRKTDEWKIEVEKAKEQNLERERIFKGTSIKYDQLHKEFEEEKKKANEAIEDIRSRYQKSDKEAIEEYCDLVLNRSQYPDYFPQNWQLEYRPENRILVLNYSLPSPEVMPKIESYKYVKTKDEIVSKDIPVSKQKTLFDNTIYQICIRTIHELFEADVINAIDAIAFNGMVTNINPATGKEETKIIASVSTNKEKFVQIDLSNVEPKATFKHLKGVSAASLIDLAAIPPIIKLDKEDRRFIEGRNVVSGLDDSVNIAAMDWEDFEHLIRELFEKEFLANGGEVKVTQASADKGVDAVAFDPDPIRGGKIVIQAKRYTNVVGVAAVRDLYGTVMNEGATKGILVTTSDYGKDSYEFAQGKPLTLLNGSNLLSLLEKHGHKAKINIQEAKRILSG